jgi:hypothetical protein
MSVSAQTLKGVPGNLPATVGAIALRPKATARSNYLIDRYHVVFDAGVGWQCVCAEFTTTHDCRHIRESQGRHAAQAVIANRLLRPREHGSLLRWRE